MKEKKMKIFNWESRYCWYMWHIH